MIVSYRFWRIIGSNMSTYRRESWQCWWIWRTKGILICHRLSRHWCLIRIIVVGFRLSRKSTLRSPGGWRGWITWVMEIELLTSWPTGSQLKERSPCSWSVEQSKETRSMPDKKTHSKSPWRAILSPWSHPKPPSNPTLPSPPTSPTSTPPRAAQAEQPNSSRSTLAPRNSSQWSPPPPAPSWWETTSTMMMRKKNPPLNNTRNSLNPSSATTFVNSHSRTSPSPPRL